jgi:hypothetical protein
MFEFEHKGMMCTIFSPEDVSTVLWESRGTVGDIRLKCGFAFRAVDINICRKVQVWVGRNEGAK